MNFAVCRVTVVKARALTQLHSVRQGDGFKRVEESYMEDSLHCWLIKAGESFPGICGLHLRCSKNSADIKKISVKGEVVTLANIAVIFWAFDDT